jgi:hypothetical protein
MEIASVGGHIIRKVYPPLDRDSPSNGASDGARLHAAKRATSSGRARSRRQPVTAAGAYPTFGAYYYNAEKYPEQPCRSCLRPRRGRARIRLLQDHLLIHARQAPETCGWRIHITLRLASARPVPIGRGMAPLRPDCPGRSAYARICEFAMDRRRGSPPFGKPRNPAGIFAHTTLCGQNIRPKIETLR